MTRAEFDRQRQLHWVYLRRQGKCAVCGQEVSRAEAAISTAIRVALGIDELLKLHLMHCHRKMSGAGWTGNLVATAASE